MPEAAVAPPPAPTPTPDVTPTGPPPKTGMPMSDAWGDLDKYATLPKAEPSAIPKGPSSKAKAAEPAKPPEPPKPAEVAKTPDEPKPDEPAKQPAESPKLPDTGKAKKPADFLREKLASVERERNEFKAEIERLKSAKPAEDPEKKSLSERLESEAKRRQELEDEIKFSHYEKSTEFKEKYHQPYVDAYRTAQKKTASFKVVQREDADTGQVIQQSRAATPEDFDRIAALPDAEAAELARQLFGEAASNLVLWHREKVLDLAQAQMTALEEYRKHGAEREKQVGELRTKQQKEMTDLFHKLNTEAAEKYPQWFKETEGDEEGNALLKKGYERADLAFSNPNLPTQKLVELHSEIRNKAAAFPRLIYQNKSLQARITELEAELAQYKGSEPKGAEGVSTSPAKQEPMRQGDDIDGVLGGLDKYAKEAF